MATLLLLDRTYFLYSFKVTSTCKPSATTVLYNCRCIHFIVTINMISLRLEWTAIFTQVFANNSSFVFFVV